MNINDFKPGMRIRLVSTTDRFTDLVPGDRGTVLRAGDDRWDYRYTSESWGQFIDIAWDNGSSLTMLPGRGDVIEINEPNPAGALFRAER